MKHNLNLWLLDLGDNQISEIRGLENLKNLKVLNLDNNFLTSVKGIEALLSLQELYLQYNGISKFPVDILVKFPYLEEVATEKNRLINFEIESIKRYCKNNNIRFII